MWHDSDSSGTGPYVSHPTGLFPAPFSRGDIAQDSTLVVGKLVIIQDIWLGVLANRFIFRKRSDFFRMLGQFIAKALLDSRIIDISLNRIFLKLVLGEEVPLTMASLKVCPFFTIPLVTRLIKRELDRRPHTCQFLGSSTSILTRQARH